MGKKYKNDVLSVLQVWEGGPLWFFFYFWGQGPDWVCWNFVEKEASFDFCPCLNISHRMYRKGLKNKLNFFFPLWNKIWGGDNFFLSDQCIARPLIYVDVSLHSNKKKNQKSKSTCLSVECFSRIPSLHHAAANRRPAWVAFYVAPGAEWHWSVSSSSFLCVGPSVS